MAQKWRGVSLHQLNQKAARIRSLKTAIGELGQLLAEAGRAHLAELARVLGREPGGLMLGSWPCGESPVQECVYDMNSEEQEEECLFCQLPLERK